MNRRDFLKKMTYGIVSGIGLSLFANGCLAKVSKEAENKSFGKPYRCDSCGYLTRSDKDLTGTRCPRCFSKQMKEISESEMTKYLSEENKD